MLGLGGHMTSELTYISYHFLVVGFTMLFLDSSFWRRGIHRPIKFYHHDDYFRP